MEKILGHKNDEQMGVAGDQAEHQQQQNSTLTNGDNGLGFRGGEGRSSESESGKGKEHRKQGGGDTDTSRTIPPFTEGYGTTGAVEGSEPGEKQHGFANAV